MWLVCVYVRVRVQYAKHKIAAETQIHEYKQAKQAHTSRF